MYYDVVASLYSPDGFLRLDAHLVAGGFDTLAAADAWRNDHRAEIERLNDSEDEAAGIAEQYTRIDPPELDWVECRATNVEEV